MSKIFTSSLISHQPTACALMEGAITQGKLAHAYLLTGRNDISKWELAKQLACYLNCTKNEHGSCVAQGLAKEKQCQNCQWILGGAHPQAWLSLVETQTKTGKISVEKARLLAEELSKTSIYFRAVIVPQAQQDIFHRPSANALLKTIEEPGTNTIFILFANHEKDVLSTIVSRCQIICLPKPQVSGMWLGSEFEESETINKIDQLKSLLWKDETKQFDFTNVQSATSTVASTLAWSAKINELIDDETPAYLIIDLIAATEIERLKSAAIDDPRTTLYLQNLLKLVEATKSQIEHYVQSKSAIESFALSCQKL